MIKQEELSSIVKILKAGGVGVLPTDTLYGLVGQADGKKAVTRIKKLKERGHGKPFIILISSLKDLNKFKVKLDKKTGKFLKTIWPGPVSVILPTLLKLHGTSVTLAFRWPKNKFLNELIEKTGPLVAPSANPEGLPPASTITEARNYFGDDIDFYLSAGKKLSGQPSTLIKIKKAKIEILREGQGLAGLISNRESKNSPSP